MKKLLITAALCLATSVAPLSTSAAAEPAFQFKLPSAEGREWSDADFEDKQLIVVAFVGTECPLVKLYGPRLQQISEKYGDNVAVIGMNSNTQDTLTEMAAFAERHGIRFPMLKDKANTVADQFAAKRTPEVFLLDEDRKVRYHGLIDDQYGVGIVREKPEKTYLADAIDDLLAARPVAVAETDVIGCIIGRVKEVEPTGDITYTKHIAAIFNNRCVECHREGELAPFSMTSYDDIIGWEDMICEVIGENRMPPWFANEEYGEFKNDCRMSTEEKDTVYQWVANGMPEGDPADLPEQPEFVVGWGIGEPDQVIYMSEEPFTVQAQGTIDYQHFIVDPGWTEDKYISAAEGRPGNSSVVHHILVFVLPPGQDRLSGLEQTLIGYAPGSRPSVRDGGIAARVEAGSKLLFQMHYTPNGYVEEDRSYAGVKFMDEKDVKQLIRARIAIQPQISIPPNESNHIVTSDYQVTKEEYLVSMTPHMHLRGKAFRYEAHFPNGHQEVLLDVPNFDFNWQIKYTLAEPRLLPVGTKIHCTAAFDNSRNNPVNPNPDITVTWGDQSWEEMMIGWFATLPAEEFSAEGPAPLKSSASIDPSGSYAWKQGIPGKLTLELNGDILSGTLNSSGNDFKIEQAVITGDQLKFSVDAGRLILDFEATVSSDGLTGKTSWTAEAAGRTGTSPWVAKKSE